MLIQLVGRTLRSNNCGILSADSRHSGYLSKVTSSKLKKLIQPVLIQLKRHTLHSDNSDTLISDNGSTGHLSKVTSGKLKKLIQPV